MGLGHTSNPNGGVLFRRGLEKPTQVYIARLRPGDLDETPCADPYAGCCGGWGRKTPGYPIMRFHYLKLDLLLSLANVISQVFSCSVELLPELHLFQVFKIAHFIEYLP